MPRVRPSGLLQMRVDVVDRLLDGTDLFRLFVRDLALELVLEGHHELDCVERIGAQVLDERGLVLDVRFVHAQLLGDDLLDPLFDVFHYDSPPTSVFDQCNRASCGSEIGARARPKKRADSNRAPCQLRSRSVHEHATVDVQRRAFRQVQAMYIDSFSPEEDEIDTDCMLADIRPAEYKKANVDEVAQAQTHLTQKQRDELRDLLRQFPKLFSGELGKYPGRKIHLDIDPTAKPVRRRPYPVAHAHLKLFKDELDRLCQLGVLKKAGASQWSLPTFIIPKKDGTIRWVSDLRELNKVIKRKAYPLPRITDVLRRRSGYKYFTKLDISMQYYTFELDDESKEVCTISTPFGNYQYQRMPMGCCQSSDYAQEIMEAILADIAEIECYIDDVGVFTDTWQKHLHILDVVLSRLQANNFTINPLKCEWAVQETDFLGHWLTPTGIKPWKKKIEAILKLDRPTSITEVRSFIGAVNFYRDMYPKRSHILDPLHELTGLKKGSQFQWLPKHQMAFDAMKAVMAQDAYIRYPDHNQPFHVFTDASDLQLGAVIMQDNKPVAFYSRKLNSAQRNYTTMEKELLSIVETLKEFRTMLYGCKELHVHTDHKNLTYANLNSQRVMRWRLYLEEYNPIFHYIKGEDNTLADALSRLPRKEGEGMTAFPKGHSVIQNRKARYNGIDDDQPNDITNSGQISSSILMDDPELAECFLNFPDVDHEHPFALDYETIANAQQQEAQLVQQVQLRPANFSHADIGNGQAMIVYRKQPDDQPKICIPDSMLTTLVAFYHRVLGHAGSNRVYSTMAKHFHHLKLAEEAKRLTSTCDPCQRYKNSTLEYGKLPPRLANDVPWSDIAVDLIGPWKIRDQNGMDHAFHALTIIDTVTNYCEIIQLKNKTAEHVAMQFENNWLARYPRPNQVIMDPGSEFKGAFREMLARHGILPQVTTVKNPQANAVCERLHQTVADILRPLTFAHPPRHVGDSRELLDSALATAAYATRTALHSTLKLSPGALIFNRDMLLDIPVIADLQLLRDQRQHVIDKNLERANRKRIAIDYKIGDQVLKLVYQPDKLEPRAIGPYPITQVHANGTLTIRLSQHVTQRVNIRKVKPYKTL